MKLLSVLILAAAGALTWVALRAEEPSYVAPTLDEMPSVVPHELTGEVPDGFQVRRFEVEGICCDGCSGKLYARLDGMEGVREAAVDPVLGRAEVVVASASDPEAVVQALTFGKYTARPVD